MYHASRRPAIILIAFAASGIAVTFNLAEETYDYFCEPHELAGTVGTIRVVQQ